MGKPLLIVCMLAGTLAAQEPLPAAQGHLDLEVLAKKIDPGETPAVLSFVPQALVQQSEEIVKGASPAELDAVLLCSDRDDPVFRAAAIHVLGQSDAARGTAAGLLREILACATLGQTSSVTDELRRMLGTGDGEEGWDMRARAPARRRACALAARLLREHADDAATVELLARLADLVDDATAEVRDEGMRRLGERASASHWLWHARAMLRDLDVGRAEASLAAAAAARPTTLVERRLVAQGLFDLRRRLAAAKRHVDAASKPGLEGQIAHLRFLQAANPAAALEESRKLVAAAVDHALPYSVLASQAALASHREEAEQHLARATNLPGRDMLTVSVAFWNRILPQVRRLREQGVEVNRQALATMLSECDGMLGDDSSDEALFYRWLRKELHWLEGSAAGFEAVLPQAIALQASMPDSLQAYQILLAAALFAQDAKAARAVLLRPLPEAIGSLHDAAWQRACCYVVRDLREDRAPVAAELDQVLGDLERVQQDPGDARYLRGVRTWWEATRPDAGAGLRGKARECFAAAQRTFGQRGLWRAASALGVVEAALGESVDDAQLERAYRQDGFEDRNRLVACPTLYFLGPGIDMAVVTELQRGLQAFDHDGCRAIMHSACAGARQRLGDAEGARAAARIALQASAEDTATRLSLGRGVVVLGEFRMDLGMRTARPDFKIVLALDLLVVPVVMDRERLQRLVDGK